MKVFVAGATGYIGGAVVAALLRRGDRVTGLARSNEKAAALRKAGMDPVMGTLDDTGLLERLSSESDAVINVSISEHRASVAAITDALRGSNKSFIHTSGVSVISDLAWGARSEKVYDEQTPFEPTAGRVNRVAIDKMVIGSARDGVTSSVIYPGVVYGDGNGRENLSAQFSPTYIKLAARHRAGVYIGAGENVMSTVHIDDLVDLYLLALEGAPAGASYFAEDGECTMRELAGYVSRMLGFGGAVVSITRDAAIREFGEPNYYGSNGRVRGVRARRELGWKPGARPLNSLPA
ncbi:NAD-dependent epimerase/dehydratase family protein [Bradyrhizobium hipponense]|uniref:NAD-dependent epimerase/dehydratase family protein n=1 Tax=Bradyrhizobium hipponense TaxID=2605638 RepID=A0A5S4YKM9_9BRAD|nr:NAD-dependent epimerase/dehydratase family protein [Bradyrhizobium hipponense]TYO60879.1 NAD-dependent epimerase/dehydratase family protein [Bradyrhizobium hipponense]